MDTSTLVGSVLRSGSIPGKAFRRALDSFELCICAETLSELETVLARERFAKYATHEARGEFVDLIRESAKHFAINCYDLDNVMPRCRDASDTMILALAAVCAAEFIVSSDQDLLVLHPWQGVAILTPTEFMARVEI